MAGVGGAAEGECGDRGEAEDGIDRDRAGGEAFGDRESAAAVGGEDGRTEGVGPGVGASDRLVEIGDGIDRDERAEGLFPHGGGVLRDVHQDDGVDVRRPEGCGPAVRGMGAGGERLLHMAFHGGELGREDSGP